jgi:hypothetical protein
MGISVATSCSKKDSKSDPVAATSASGAIADTKETTTIGFKDNNLDIPVGALEVGAKVSIEQVADPADFSSLYAAAPKASAAIQLAAQKADGTALDAASGQLQLALSYDPALALAAVEKTAANLCVLAQTKEKKYLWRSSQLLNNDSKKTVNIYTKYFGVYQVVYCGTAALEGFEEAVASAPFSAAGSTGSFLTAADFVVPTTTNEIEQTELTDKINNSSTFYDNEPVDPEPPTTGEPSGETDTNPCSIDAKIAAAGDTLSLKYDIDLAPCLSKNATSLQGSTLIHREKLYMKMTCVGVDLSSYNGKDMDDLPDGGLDTICSTATTVSVLSNMVIEYAFTVIEGDKTVTNQHLMKSGMFADDGSACSYIVAADGSYTINGCNDYYISNAVFGPESTTSTDYKHFKSNNLKGKTNGLYYTGGSYAFAFNNWNGTMTYTDAATAPTWTATSKSGGTANGTFAPYRPQALYLKNMLPKPGFFKHRKPATP